MKPIRTVLCAVDFSKTSEAALEAAVDLTRRLGARLHVVHAFEVPIPTVSPYEVAIPEAYLEESRRAAAQRLADAVASAKKGGVEAEQHLIDGPPAHGIVACAKELGADLVVVGTHGHTGLKHLLLGSVAERVLRHAPCAVLTVKADA